MFCIPSDIDEADGFAGVHFEATNIVPSVREQADLRLGLYDNQNLS